MKLSRDVTYYLHVILDQWLPPALRDQRWFMAPLIRMLFRHRTQEYLDFKDAVHGMSEEDFRAAYQRASEVMFERDTDLNRECIDKNWPT